MELTSENYFSHEAEVKYISASQVKSFKRCEAAAVAELSGAYRREMSQALMVGQYVDAALTGDLDDWCGCHPEIKKRDGTLRAEFLQASEMVGRANRDKLFMEFMEGDHQTILKAPILGGYWFKAKLDVLGGGRIVDLKTVRDLSPVYLPGQGRVDFATAWDWPLQMAIYQKIYEQVSGEKLPCYLAVITKETPADLAVIQVEQERMDAEIAWLETALPRIEALKEGLIEPERCGRCAYCRESHQLTGPVMLGEYEEIGGSGNE
jgi:hypothetical protein